MKSIRLYLIRDNKDISFKHYINNKFSFKILGKHHKRNSKYISYKKFLYIIIIKNIKYDINLYK